MQPVMSALLAFVVALFRSRASLCLENLALRHQVAIYKQTGSRPRLRPIDRLLWGWLSRLWSGWQEALTFVQPRTVIAWQRRRFRVHWRRLSQRGTPGRPALAKESVKKLGVLVTSITCVGGLRYVRAANTVAFCPWKLSRC
jgi:hypothetical protein